jgi:hypothetical protein
MQTANSRSAEVGVFWPRSSESCLAFATVVTNALDTCPYAKKVPLFCCCMPSWYCNRYSTRLRYLPSARGPRILASHAKTSQHALSQRCRLPSANRPAQRTQNCVPLQRSRKFPGPGEALLQHPLCKNHSRFLAFCETSLNLTDNGYFMRIGISSGIRFRGRIVHGITCSEQLSSDNSCG